MSGKSGQLLTSTFFDDCENIVLYNGYPVFKINFNEFFESDGRVTFSSFEDASKRLGLSVDVLKDLTRLGNVNLLSDTAEETGIPRISVFPFTHGSFGRKSSADNATISTGVMFGDYVNGHFELRMSWEANGEWISGEFNYVIE